MRIAMTVDKTRAIKAGFSEWGRIIASIPGESIPDDVREILAECSEKTSPGGMGDYLDATFLAVKQDSPYRTDSVFSPAIAEATPANLAIQLRAMRKAREEKLAVWAQEAAQKEAEDKRQAEERQKEDEIQKEKLGNMTVTELADNMAYLTGSSWIMKCNQDYPFFRVKDWFPEKYALVKLNIAARNLSLEQERKDREVRREIQSADIIFRLGSQSQKERFGETLLAQREIIDLLVEEQFAAHEDAGFKRLDPDKYHFPEAPDEADFTESVKHTLTDSQWEMAKKIKAVVKDKGGVNAEYFAQSAKWSDEDQNYSDKCAVIRLTWAVGEFTVKGDFKI